MNEIKSEKSFVDKPELPVKSLLDEIIEETTIQMAAKAKAEQKVLQSYPVTSPCPATFGAAKPPVSYPVTYPCPATFGMAKAA